MKQPGGLFKVDEPPVSTYGDWHGDWELIPARVGSARPFHRVTVLDPDTVLVQHGEQFTGIYLGGPIPIPVSNLEFTQGYQITSDPADVPEFAQSLVLGPLVPAKPTGVMQARDDHLS